MPRLHCFFLALGVILAPACLRGQERVGHDQDRQGQEGRAGRQAETLTKLRNEIEENWIRQYRSISPSESMKVGRESTQTTMEAIERVSAWQKRGKTKPGKRSF